MDNALFHPETKGQVFLFAAILFLVALSIVHLSVSVQYPELTEAYAGLFKSIEWLLTILFTIEIIARIALRPAPRAYLLTPAALIDVLAVLPTWLGLFLPFQGGELTWMRSLRTMRLLRTAKLMNYAGRIENRSLSLLARIAPYMALAFAVKAVLLFLEGLGLWPTIPGLGTVVSVVGFAIGVLLSTKLGTVQGRMYTFEERIAHLLGAVDAARPHSPNPQLLDDWLYQVYRTIRTGCSRDAYDRANEALIQSHQDRIPAPIWVRLHQNAQFLLHRMWTVTPESYDQVLKNITIIYIAAVILTIPGLTGLLASFLVVYVLGGLFLVIDSMDRPFDPSGHSMINSDLGSLERYLAQMGYDIRHPD